MRTPLLALVFLLVAGCHGDPVDTPPTESPDAPEEVSADTGSSADTGGVDTQGVVVDSTVDSTVVDSTVVDSSPGDSNVVDSGTVDTSVAPDADAGSDGSTWIDSGPCGVHPGPRMVQLTTSKGTFCVDTTEVSNAQYAEFSAAAVRPAMPAYCKFKTGYSVENPLSSAKSLPVVNVDWCDAYQYCAWAGKRLCGGMAGGHVVRSGTTIAEYVADSQWTLVCQNNVPTTYSTGNTFPGGDAGVCNITNNGGEVWSVTSGSECKGAATPFDQVVNLTGNAGEWEDNCTNFDESLDAGATSSVVCFVRGGTPSTCCVNDFDYKCTAANIITARGSRLPKVGFRCCSK